MTRRYREIDSALTAVVWRHRTRTVWSWVAGFLPGLRYRNGRFY